MDELEYHYECMGKEEMQKRLDRIGVIGAPGVFFDDENYDIDIEEDNA